MAPPTTRPHYSASKREPRRAPRSVDSEERDPHLRSVVEVIGYHIHATDGDIGHVENFMLDCEGWNLRYFVVDTSNWWLGKRVLVAMQAVKGVDWSDRHVGLDASREQVETSPPWDPMVAFGEIEKTHLHRHYGWPMSQP